METPLKEIAKLGLFHANKEFICNKIFEVPKIFSVSTLLVVKFLSVLSRYITLNYSAFISETVSEILNTLFY